MMGSLQTKAFGTIDVDATDLIDFPDGLIGISDRRFALLSDGEDSPFKWLQSASSPGLAFVLMQPELFLKTAYRPAVAASELERLEVSSIEECHVYAIITIPTDNPEAMTANLQGPILLNLKRKIGRQVISNNDDHSVRHLIIENLDT
ncbi:MAG: flagellar assembly protein FliW [Spirochaetales bacterium]|nr:flagellar assembly protein FliW [Spirochaetales bacterium]